MTWNTKNYRVFGFIDCTNERISFDSIEIVFGGIVSHVIAQRVGAVLRLHSPTSHYCQEYLKCLLDLFFQTHGKPAWADVDIEYGDYYQSANKMKIEWVKH